MSGLLRERKPWPMKWVVVVTIVFIAGYTYLTLHYRKPGRDYRPYEDFKTRVNTARLLAAGYRRMQIPVERPTENPPSAHNTAFPAPGGVPDDLQKIIVAKPLLPGDIVGAFAPASASSREDYRILFRCTVPDDKKQLAGAELYVKGDTIVITPDFELLAPGLLTRSRDTLVLLTIPGGALKPGDYRVTLAGEHTSRSWTLQLK